MKEDEFRRRVKWKIDTSTGCWTVTSHKRKIKHKNKDLYISRLAYGFWVDSQANPKHVVRACGNTSCINPQHMVTGVHPLSRLSPETVMKIRADGDYKDAIAEKYGVHITTIAQIKSGKAWAHLPGDIIPCKERPQWEPGTQPMDIERKIWGNLEQGDVYSTWHNRIVYRELDNGCWEVVSHKKFYNNPYPTITINGQSIGMHRFSFMKHYGEIPDGRVICHHCDNTNCINPLHLYAGTRSDNTQDMISRGRIFDNRGLPRQRLTDEQIREIRYSEDSSYILSPQHGVTPTHIRRIKSGARCREI